MILTKEQTAEFETAARPLIKFLNDRCHSHVTVVVGPTHAELSEGVYSLHTVDYVKD